MHESAHNTHATSTAAPTAVDLSQLAVERQPPALKAARRRRPWVTRYAIPAAILSGFGGLFAWAARDSFLPAQSVTVAPVIVARAEVHDAGAPLFQAAGWIEPRPSATDVTSLVPGVVEKVLVVEGQLLEQGQPIAQLLDVDAKLAVQQAEAAARLAEADVEGAASAVTAAQAALDNPNELKAELAEAESALASARLTLGNLPFLIDTAETRRKLAEEALARKQSAGEAIPGRVLREAEAELASAASALGELQSRKPTLTVQIEALDRKRQALAKQLEQMTSHKRALAAAKSALAVAQARRDQARLSLQTAQLTLSRMTIKAPIAGRVLTLDARPGMRLAGMDPVVQHSGSVISMYDPHQLQVRVDVRLEDVPQLRVGQPTTIETAASSKPLSGEVAWLTTRADIQKNTLQVKVVIHDPPTVVTPEMLAQVTFLAPPQPDRVGDAESERMRMLVPRSLVVASTGEAHAIWLADSQQGLAELRSIELGVAGSDELVEVVRGLDPTCKLIVANRQSLAPGERIRIVGDDDTLGVAAPRTAATASASAARAAVEPK